MLGTVATSVAVICIAGVGYQFLTGRIPTRRAATVILGCFILFGAGSIAAALAALGDAQPVTREVEPEAPPPPIVTAPPHPPSREAPNPFDPYGGQ